MQLKKILLILLGVICCTCFATACKEEDTNGKCTHTYEVLSEQEATCKSAKEITYECSQCKEIKTETIGSALGHEYNATPDTDNAPNCVSYGEKQYNCIREGCNEIKIERYGEALGHDYQWVEPETEATCDVPQVRRGTCSRCLNVIEEKVTVPHAYEENESKSTAANCTESGKDVFNCTKCGDEYFELIPAIGHTSDGLKNEVVASTCLTNGYTVKHCTICNSDYQTNFEKKADHNFVAGACIFCSYAELDLAGAVTCEEGEVVYLGDNAWSLTGETEKVFMNWKQLYFTVTAEKLQQFRDNGFNTIALTLRCKSGQKTWAQLYKANDLTATGLLDSKYLINENVLLKLDITDITEDLSYCLSYRSHDDPGKSNGAILALEGIYPFDEDDQTTWYDTSETKESVENGEGVKFSKEGDYNAQIGVTVTAEAIGYLKAQGYTRMKFTLTSDSNRIEVYRDCLVHAAGVTTVGSSDNGSYTFTIDITDTNVANGQQLLFVPVMRSETNVIGNITARIDGAGLQVGNQATWYDTSEDMESVDNGEKVKFSKAGTYNAQIGVTLTAEAIAYLKSQGNNKIQFTVTSDTQKIEIYRDCLVHAAGVTAVGVSYEGSYTFIIDITDANLADGQQLLFVPVMQSETTVMAAIIVEVVGILGENTGETLPPEDSTSTEFVDLVDFVVDVQEDRNIRVLQITDTQIIDAMQTRPGRTGVYYDQWAPENMQKACFQYISQAVASYKPDLIIMTGDLVYGEFDDNGTSLLALINFMDSLQIPWAPVFGNHENESKKGADWQCEQLENAQYCLFKQRTLTGNGNYSIGITHKGTPVRVFYMLDSNGCSAASDESLANGHTVTTVGLANDQIAWYEASLKAIQKNYTDVTYSLAFHIQPQIFASAFSTYGYTGSSEGLPIDIDKAGNKAATDFGYIGRVLKGPWGSDGKFWSSVKANGIDSIFVGHEHCNSASVVYEGVRLAYGLKTGQYDRANYKQTDGSIVGSYEWSVGTPIVGATAIEISLDGKIVDSHHIYCEDQVKDFDENDQATWYQTTEVKASIENGTKVQFSKDGDYNAQIGVTVKSGAIAYLQEQGYTKMQFTVSSDVQRIEVYRDCLVHAAGVTLVGVTGNGNYTFTIDITDTNVEKGQQLLFVPVMQSQTSVVASIIVEIVGLTA